MSGPAPPRVTLLSDFGTADGYAAAMAGVIAAVAPSALTEHVAHDIAPGDIQAASLTLARYAFLYPPGTVHLAVVDPGVGTDRDALAATIEGRHFVAPDNGLITRVMQDREVTAVHLDPDVVRRAAGHATWSDTFHGRDLFAPAAGLLARGESLAALGAPLREPLTLTLPAPRPHRDGVEGQVVQVDRFGNLVTDIPGERVRALGPDAAIRIEAEGGAMVDPGPLRRTYGQGESGSLVALIGSLDTLEISIRDGSAARRLGTGRGARVTVAGPPPRNQPAPSPTP